MVNEEGLNPGAETATSPERSEGTVRVQGDDGEIYFLDPNELTLVEEPEKEQPPKKPSEPPEKEYATEVDPNELRELVTQIIAFDVENYDELNALVGISLEELQKMSPEERQAKEIEMQEKFDLPALKFFENGVVHYSGQGERRFGIDARTNEPIVFNTTDLDGRGAVSLLRMAGVFTENIKFIKAGEHVPGKVNLDTSGHWGLVVGLPGEGEKGLSPDEVAERNLRKTVIIDHHGASAPKTKSATEWTYEVLRDLGMLEFPNERSREAMEKLVQFITERDNGRGPHHLFDQSHRTIWGLADRMPFDSRLDYTPTRHEERNEDLWQPGLFDYFRSGASPDQILTDAELEALSLTTASKDQEKQINDAKERYKALEENGFVVKSPRYGTIIVDYQGGIGEMRIPSLPNWSAIKFFGGDTMIKWDDRGKGFFISASEDFDDKVRGIVKYGEIQRGTMWVCPGGDNEDTLIGDILQAMEVPKEEIMKSRRNPDGSFNTQGLFSKIQREEEGGRKVYNVPERPKRR